MAFLSICGGTQLHGEVINSGAKNAALPILAACVLVKGTCVIHNCPDISDVEMILELLKSLGCAVERQTNSVTVNAAAIHSARVPMKPTQQMRASVLLLGALYARLGEAEVCRPGGCTLGERPIDFHLFALQKLGADVQEDEMWICCRRQQTAGGFVHFPYPSVGATENAILAAVGCCGDSILHGCAREPEIVDLCCFLRACGAKITGDGSQTIFVSGNQNLHGTEYSIIPDRMEAVSFLCAAAGCGGDITLHRTRPQLYDTECRLLESAGCRLVREENCLTLVAPKQLKPIPLATTAPYPRLSTDAQPPFMAALLRAQGVSRFCETVFERRFSHIPQMCKLGAKIEMFGRYARVTGGMPLHACTLEAADLRAAAALMIAAMMAQGESALFGIEYLQRGYCDFPGKLNSLGAAIRQIM